jgi:hypothetical protein
MIKRYLVFYKINVTVPVSEKKKKFKATCVEAERAGGLHELPKPAYLPPWEGGRSLKKKEWI